MFKTIGVCGTGNMGQAIVKGLVSSKAMAADHIYLYNIHREKADALAKENGSCRRRFTAEISKALPSAYYGRQAEYDETGDLCCS